MTAPQQSPDEGREYLEYSEYPALPSFFADQGVTDPRVRWDFYQLNRGGTPLSSGRRRLFHVLRTSK
jgi:hypothetical protein